MFTHYVSLVSVRRMRKTSAFELFFGIGFEIFPGKGE